VKPEAATGRGVLLGSWRLAAVAAIVVLLVVVAVGRQAFAAAAPVATPEAHAYAIGERLACPICEGLSVADSPSALAQQMRAEITDQIAAGQSDAQIQQYFVARYGPAILLTPPKQGFTLLAWWVPVLFIVAIGIGIGLAAYRWSRRPATDEVLPALTAEEERQYAARLAAQLPGPGGEGPRSGVAGEDPLAGFGNQGPHSGFRVPSGCSPPGVGESQYLATGRVPGANGHDDGPGMLPSSRPRSSPPRMGERPGEGACSQPTPGEGACSQPTPGERARP
jgi:cytochrome c-type biogenesis protein CcmH